MEKSYFVFIFILLNIITNGQIGINTSSPTQTLDVNGTFRVREVTDKSTDIVFNKVLVADAAGNVNYVPKSTLNQPFQQLFNRNTLPSVQTDINSTASNPIHTLITSETIILTKPALLLINFSVPVSISVIPTDGRARILRTHLLVDGKRVTKSTNTYSNHISTGTNLSGLFYNKGSYFILLQSGTHTIGLEAICFDRISCIQGGQDIEGVSFQAVAMYNEF